MPLDRPTLSVQIAFPSTGGSNWMILNDTTYGKLDTAELGDGPTSDSAWTDVTEYVISVDTRRGRSRQLESFEAGTFSIELDNSDRRFDPTNLAGPYVLAGVSSIRPMLLIRVMATWGSIQYPLIRGYADAWSINWQDPQISTATVSGTDAFKVLANYNPLGQTAVGGNELTHVRLTRIADNASFPTSDRLFDTGLVALQETTLAQNALSEMKLAVDSEMGDLFIDGSGRLVFRNRTSRYTRPASRVPQASYGDDSTDFTPVRTEIKNDDELIKNKVSISNSGGTAATSQDTDSQASYLLKTWQRFDLIHYNSAYSQINADLLVQRFKDAELRFDAVTLMPDAYDSGTLWPEVLGREIGDRITIQKTSIPGGGTEISRDCFIEGISHTIPKLPGPWITTFQLSDASKFYGMILDDTTYGVLNATTTVLV